MSPPLYSDLGKSARDVFGKGYHFGNLKLDVKTRSSTGVAFNATAVANTDTSKLNGALETKYKLPEYGLVLTEKWNTDNNIVATVDIEDKLMKGLKVSLDTAFSPDSGAKSGKLKGEFKHDNVTVSKDVDLNVNGPLVNAAFVVEHQGWLAGYQMAFDSSKSRLTKNNFAVGFSARDFTLHTHVNDGQLFGGSVYQRVNGDLETGVQLGWNAGNNATKFAIGAKYRIDKDAFARAKIDNDSKIGLGYQQRLRDGVTLILSMGIDGKNLNQGGHQLGLALEVEA